MLHNCGAVDGMLPEYQLQTWDGLGIKCDAARAVGTPRGRLGLRFDITGAGLGHSTAMTSDTTQDAPKMAWMGLCSSTAMLFASTASAQANRSCTGLRGWPSYSGFFVLFVLGRWPRVSFKGNL